MFRNKSKKYIIIPLQFPFPELNYFPRQIKLNCAITLANKRSVNWRLCRRTRNKIRRTSDYIGELAITSANIWDWSKIILLSIIMLYVGRQFR